MKKQLTALVFKILEMGGVVSPTQLQINGFIDRLSLDKAPFWMVWMATISEPFFQFIFLKYVFGQDVTLDEILADLIDNNDEIEEVEA